LQRGYALLYQVPCFYVYTRCVSRGHKIYKQVIDLAAKDFITGSRDKEFSPSYFASAWRKFILELRRMRTQLGLHRSIYFGLVKFKKSNRYPR